MRFIFENNKHEGGKNHFLVEAWSNEGYITKVVELIVMDFG